MDLFQNNVWYGTKNSRKLDYKSVPFVYFGAQKLCTIDNAYWGSDIEMSPMFLILVITKLAECYALLWTPNKPLGSPYQRVERVYWGIDHQ